MKPFIIAFVLICMPPDLPTFESVDPPERMTENWDERRWVEFLANRKSCEAFVPTASGAIIELSMRSELYEVAQDEDWREAISQAILCSASSEKEPGVWLLCPDGRTKYYMECLVVVHWLRSYGVPIRIQTLATPSKIKGQ